MKNSKPMNACTEHAEPEVDIMRLLCTHRWCYTVMPAQDTSKYGGYVPSLVIENQRGHWPMLGRGNHSSPWVWGKTLGEAEDVCRSVNAERGISPEDEMKIVASSMRRCV